METQELSLTHEGIKLKGYLYLPGKKVREKESTPLMILCHGIPRKQEDKVKGESEDGGYPALAERCVKEGFPTFHFNFRGAGESEGNFDLQGWTRDLNAFLDYIEDTYPNSAGNFYLWGFSAGAAVCTYLASQDSRVKATALAACPADFKSLFPESELQNLLHRLRDTGIIKDAGFPSNSLKWLENIHSLSPVKYVGQVAPTPLLIVHGDQDELIPVSHAYQLFESAAEPKRILILPGAKHQLRKEEEAVEKCLQWFKKSDLPR